MAHARILNHTQDSGGWHLLLMFPRWCLTTTSGKRHRQQLQDYKERLRLCLARGWRTLHADYLTAIRIYNDRLPYLRAAAPPSTPEVREQRLLTQVLKLIKAGHVSKAAP